MKGDVFSSDMIEAYIDLKMEDVTRLRMTTHPAELICIILYKIQIFLRGQRPEEVGQAQSFNLVNFDIADLITASILVSTPPAEFFANTSAETLFGLSKGSWLN